MSKKSSTKSAPTIAVYPGTFDPITMGHMDIIHRALESLRPRHYCHCGQSRQDSAIPLDTRIEMVRQCFPEQNSRIEVASVSGLLVNFAMQSGAKAIIRGLRAVSDFDYEFQLALMNRKLEREVDTIFLMPAFRWIYISSSIIKEAARHGGDVSELVPAHVNQLLIDRFAS